DQPLGELVIRLSRIPLGTVHCRKSKCQTVLPGVDRRQSRINQCTTGFYVVPPVKRFCPADKERRLCEFFLDGQNVCLLTYGFYLFILCCVGIVDNVIQRINNCLLRPGVPRKKQETKQHPEQWLLVHPVKMGIFPKKRNACRRFVDGFRKKRSHSLYGQRLLCGKGVCTFVVTWLARQLSV